MLWTVLPSLVPWYKICILGEFWTRGLTLPSQPRQHLAAPWTTNASESNLIKKINFQIWLQRRLTISILRIFGTRTFCAKAPWCRAGASQKQRRGALEKKTYDLQMKKCEEKASDLLTFSEENTATPSNLLKRGWCRRVETSCFEASLGQCIHCLF